MRGSRYLLLLAALALTGLLLWWLPSGDEATPRASSRDAAATTARDPADPPTTTPGREPPAPPDGTGKGGRLQQSRSAMETHSDVEALRPIVQARGRALFDDGLPVAGAMLVLYSSPLPPANGEPLPAVRLGGVAVSGEDGSFEIPLARGGLWLHAGHRDGPAIAPTDGARRSDSSGCIPSPRTSWRASRPTGTAGSRSRGSRASTREVPPLDHSR